MNPAPALLLTLALLMPMPERYAPRAQRDVTWISLDETRFEHLRLRQAGAGIEADGLMVRHGDGTAGRFRYRIEGDGAWRLRKVLVSGEDAAPAVSLLSDGDGRWRDGSGRALPELDGCHDVDIQASPFTNTLAIRRLRLAPGQAAEICVAFVTVPELEVRVFRQRYTRLLGDAQGSVYLYESLESDFRSELPVDGDGLLLEYPGYFRRAGSTQPED